LFLENTEDKMLSIWVIAKPENRRALADCVADYYTARRPTKVHWSGGLPVFQISIEEAEKRMRKGFFPTTAVFASSEAEEIERFKALILEAENELAEKSQREREAKGLKIKTKEEPREVEFLTFGLPAATA
jgi:hypothetical protein